MLKTQTCNRKKHIQHSGGNPLLCLYNKLAHASPRMHTDLDGGVQAFVDGSLGLQLRG